jgi:hypothetical protein
VLCITAMKRDRLKKLARLAAGAAVVGMGPLAACTPSSVTTAPTGDNQSPPHINGPATPGTDTPTGAGDLAEAGIVLHPGVNAPPLNPPDLNAADAGAPDNNPPHRPHVNAAPPQP